MTENEQTLPTKKEKFSITRIVAHIISALSSPMLMPTIAVFIALWATSLRFAPMASRLIVLGMVFAVSCLVPIVSIIVLSGIKIIKDPSLNDRGDRFYPITVAAVCYVGLALFMPAVHAPSWLTSFMWGIAFLAAVTLVINQYWKISGHSIGMGGLTALCFFMSLHDYMLSGNDVLLYCVILASGIVMSCRLVLRCHTLSQVLAGYGIGFLVIALSQILGG